MATASEIAIGLVSGGAGASLGTIVAAAITSRTQRGESRARAADLVTTASERIIIRLERENEQMRKAILLMTDVLDELLSDSEFHASATAIAKLKQAKRAAQLAI